MADIDTRNYLSEVQALARQFRLPVESIDIVPSIQQWCRERNVPEENPFRVGKIVRNAETGRYVILMVDRITEDMVRSLTGAMELRGFWSEVGALAEPLAFIRHLALHEIAHGLDATRSEEACDRWAFEQLRTLPLTPHSRGTPRKRGAPQCER